MSEPEKNGVNLDSMTAGFPIAIGFLFITIGLFYFRDQLPYFQYILWIGLPFIAFLIVFCVNLVNMTSYCKKIDAGKALYGGIPATVAVLAGLGISSISYCRIPIASVFAPLFVGENTNIVKNGGMTNLNSLRNSDPKQCCAPKITLEAVETKYATLVGFSYGFYMFFSILFGYVYGNSIATIC